MVQTAIINDLEILGHDYLREDSQINDYKQFLYQASQLFIDKFNQHTAVVELLHARSYCIDCILTHLWHKFMANFDQQLSLIAVGGYGRNELHPHSDIDLLILYPDKLSGFDEPLQLFIVSLWDIGLKIGHSVRSLTDCISLAKNDITIATNLMESRPIVGNADLFIQMQQLTGPEHIWSGRNFFTAKTQEQSDRHLKFQKTSYSLEPNIKKSPGTLRDIQLVGWVAKRHFRVNKRQQLVALGFLTTTEFKTILKCEDFLWQVRFALHIVAGRPEDRLLFDHQKPVADMLGYTDGEHLTAVERLMKRYYRIVKTIRELNDMLLQHFSESILGNESNNQIVVIDDDFQIFGEQIEIRHENVFRDDPACLLKLFLHLADHPYINGFRASTLRRIMIDRELINNSVFRSKDENKDLFMQLFRHPHGIGRPFILMKRYGVLKAYLPAYARILGQMQYDLFHIYTVDEHTLFVLDNLSKFTDVESEQLFPLCHQVMQKVKKRELLYLGALFHDIGKGQGGNHSDIGANEALTFCQLHHLEDDDSELVSWLVKNHLLMSRTTQRKDITDPVVINQFAKIMETTEHLNNLYLLTVADIRATSPNLWNNWKDSLLQNLYKLTYQALTRGLENPKMADEAIDEAKNKVLQILKNSHVPNIAIKELWSHFKDDYFVRNSVERIAWQTEQIINHDKIEPLISVYLYPDTGATEIFVYMPKNANYFSLITTQLYEKNLSIQDASLHSTIDGYILGSFVILEVDGKPISSDKRLKSIKKRLSKNLNKTDYHFTHFRRRLPHRYSYFNIKTSVNFTLSDNGKRTLLELVAIDKPGLLARIGLAFLQLNIELHSAKVVTLGEKVEDIFSITNSREQPLESLEEQEQLRKIIYQYVESDHPEGLLKTHNETKE